jgi:tRNA nucleotidyltransferase/poly(A) polymerase
MKKLEMDWSQWDGPLQVVRRLRSKGHEAWLAGGCVRDLLLGTKPKDYDVATSAEPAQVLEIFPSAVPLKIELGVVLVPKGQPIEVTSFRSEGPYLDGRRPAWVERTTSEGDVLRRDFTINGLLLDPETGEVVDHVNGVEDLSKGILRCIRDPHERFTEDHLRLLRAVRFSVRLGFAIEGATWQALCELADGVATLSAERLHEELGKMAGQGAFRPAWKLLREGGIFEVLFPDLEEAWRHPLVESRMVALFSAPLPNDLPWIAVLGLGLCPWMRDEAPRPGGAVRDQAEAFLERLRASNQEKEAARLIWKRFPEVFAAPQALSLEASLVRERDYPALQALANHWDGQLGGQAGSRWQVVRERVMATPKPPAGQAWMAADPRLKGALLGEAIRRADAMLLDQGPQDAEVLVNAVLGVMFPAG